MGPRFHAGDDREGAGEHRRGGNAQYLVVPAANVVPRPAGLSAVEAAAIPVTFTTAWQMLVMKARVQMGETVKAGAPIVTLDAKKIQDELRAAQSAAAHFLPTLSQ